MQKIGEIHRGNANIWYGIGIGFVLTAVSLWLSIWALDLDISLYLQANKIWEVLLILPTMLLAFVIHECIHVVLFKLFGKGKARIKVSREKSVGAVVMHQVNEEVFYKRWEMIIILLSPLMLLSLFFYGLHLCITMPFLIVVNIVLNAIGSSVDVYASLILLCKGCPNIVVNFDSSMVKMNIYHLNKKL
ncbi:metalloprotease family protein [Paenibacillus polymyxa]|uniref:DUF3267 domain-containing protein n=1 Tax=Paenibacillus polymyxa (strain SC2) TaxID=886882 RepID=A0A0D5ZCN2_PAEPS|nr:metalloprotease family protein [Paenibacillus polymyxa]AKA44373.1 hypothetical protein PPSC2_27140 [Paenibacillus polymyxa SC2]WPQ59576.1 metalloprotease family protein [Paenibacillus polymyxa]